MTDEIHCRVCFCLWCVCLSRDGSHRAGCGIDQAAWYRFFALYQPVMVEFARMKGAGDDAEDVVQEVFASLAKTFQAGRYAHEKGSFRAYLTKMLRNELISRFRRVAVRPERDAVIVTESEIKAEKGLQSVPNVYSVFDDDENWKIARHRVAVEHVLTKTAISKQSRRIYRELLATGDSCAKVARRMNLPAATVRQVKSRVSRMIAAFENATK